MRCGYDVDIAKILGFYIVMEASQPLCRFQCRFQGELRCKIRKFLQIRHRRLSACLALRSLRCKIARFCENRHRSKRRLASSAARAIEAAEQRPLPPTLAGVRSPRAASTDLVPPPRCILVGGVKARRQFARVRYTSPTNSSDPEGARPCSTSNLSATTRKPSPRR